MNRLLFFLVGMVIQGCAQKPYYGDLTFLGKFPSKLSEVSGIDKDGKGNIWAIEDNGNKDRVYQINSKAQIVQELKIEDAQNHDWEDLTIAKGGTFYIGDFGNNANERKNLVIYKVTPEQLTKKTPKAEKIKFRYPQQTDFPPKKKGLLFDAEGFFHWDGFLYIFTKNRSKPYSGKTLIYRVPDQQGEYDAQFLGEIVLCKDKDHCSVTGADISKNGKAIALTGYGYLYLIEDFDFTDFSQANITAKYLRHETQIESVCFSGKESLLIADEQSQTKGRNLYSYTIKQESKTKPQPKRKS